MVDGFTCSTIGVASSARARAERGVPATRTLPLRHEINLNLTVPQDESLQRYNSPQTLGLKPHS